MSRIGEENDYVLDEDKIQNIENADPRLLYGFLGIHFRKSGKSAMFISSATLKDLYMSPGADLIKKADVNETRELEKADNYIINFEDGELRAKISKESIISVVDNFVLVDINGIEMAEASDWYILKKISTTNFGERKDRSVLWIPTKLLLQEDQAQNQ